MKTKAKRNAE